MNKFKSYAVFLFVIIIVSFLHLYFSLSSFKEDIVKNIEILPSNWCKQEQNKIYCDKNSYKVFPYVLDNDNNILFLYPNDSMKIKIKINGWYIKSYLYYLLLNLRFRSVDLFLLCFIVFFTLSFFEYTKYQFNKTNTKRLENKKENV